MKKQKNNMSKKIIEIQNQIQDMKNRIVEIEKFLSKYMATLFLNDILPKKDELQELREKLEETDKLLKRAQATITKSKTKEK